MMRNYKKLLSTMAMAGFLGAGCLGGSTPTPTNPDPSNPTNPSDPSNPTPIANNPSDPTNGNNTSSGGTGGTFDHMNDDTVDPFQVLARIQEEGPPEVSTRMHSCGKMKYATLGRVLTSMGVTMTGTGTTPNGLYTTGASAENIAWGYRTAKDVVDGWINSPGHRANIVNCTSIAVGVGLAYKSDGTPYWTQDFGRV